MALADIIDRVRPSVVQVRAESGGPPSDTATLGTGFVVAESLVVTAKHVIDAVTSGGHALSVAFAGPDVDLPDVKVRASFIGVPAEVVAVDEVLDLALVRTAATGGMQVNMFGKQIDVRPTPIRFCDWKLREGIGIAISGYPLSAPSLVTTVGTLASVFAPVGSPPESSERLLGDITANGGNSGGPVYTSLEGALIGVCVAGKLAPIQGAPGLAQTAGLTVIVPVDELRGFLSGNNVEPPPSTASNTGARGRRK